MKRTQVQFVLLLIVFAFTALTFAGTASAGWTWDDGAASGTTGWTWDDSATSPDDSATTTGWTWDDGAASPDDSGQ